MFLLFVFITLTLSPVSIYIILYPPYTQFPNVTWRRAGVPDRKFVKNYTFFPTQPWLPVFLVFITRDAYLRYCSWNCISLHEKIDTLRVLSSSRNIDLILLMETGLSCKMDDRELSLKEYSRLRRDRCIGIHGQMAAFIKSSLSYETLADPMSGEDQLELLAFKVNGPRYTQLDVILVYRPPQSIFISIYYFKRKTSRGHADPNPAPYWRL